MANKQLNRIEAGQSAVLLTLMMVGLIALVALAIDGGSVLNGRRLTQNAADGGALAGIHYIAGSDSPSESQLQMVVNRAVEANGARDTDGVPGNEVNDNVTIFYTDDRGDRLTSQPCYVVPCGAIPPAARGLDVEVAHEVNTFFLVIVERDELAVGASAAAVVRGGSNYSDVNENALLAFGSCPKQDRPLDMSLNYTDVIGGIRSNTWFVNRGNENHYHGQVYYGPGTGYVDSGDIPGVYRPNPPGTPVEGAAVGDPFASLGITVASFHCTTGSIGSAVPVCYDVSAGAGAITTQWLKQNAPPSGGNKYLYNDNGTWRMRDGLYYAGNREFFFGQNSMAGTVTLVTNSRIKITQNDVQFNGYMPANSPIPGLLFYSGMVSPNPCANFNTDPQNVPINTTGNQGSVAPKVFHNPDGSYSSYELGSLQYNGLIYAPGGRVATSGHGATYIGAIVAYSIRVNGYIEFENMYPCNGETVACRPLVEPMVSALFVNNPYLFPAVEQRIYLDK